MTGEEIIALCVLPLTDKDIEESVESGFANYFHMLYPSTVSTRSKFSWWLKTSDERRYRIPIDKIVLITECKSELKNKFVDFLEQNNIKIEDVNDGVKALVESFNDIMSIIEDDFDNPVIENTPRSVTIH